MKKLSALSNTLCSRPKLPLVYVTVLLSLSLVNCDQNKNLAAHDAGAGGSKGESPQQKPVSGKPPGYEVNLFRLGQSWTWQKKKSPNPSKPHCQRWEIIEINNSGITIEERSSLNCSSFDNTDWIQYTFTPDDGQIFSIRTAKTWVPEVKNKTVFYRLYGDGAEKRFYRTSYKTGTDSLQIFQIEGSKSWYIDDPGKPNHGVLLQDETWLLRL